MDRPGVCEGSKKLFQRTEPTPGGANGALSHITNVYDRAHLTQNGRPAKGITLGCFSFLRRERDTDCKFCRVVVKQTAGKAREQFSPFCSTAARS